MNLKNLTKMTVLVATALVSFCFGKTLPTEAPASSAPTASGLTEVQPATQSEAPAPSASALSEIERIKAIQPAKRSKADMIKLRELSGKKKPEQVFGGRSPGGFQRVAKAQLDKFFAEADTSLAEEDTPPSPAPIAKSQAGSDAEPPARPGALLEGHAEDKAVGRHGESPSDTGSFVESGAENEAENKTVTPTTALLQNGTQLVRSPRKLLTVAALAAGATGGHALQLGGGPMPKAGTALQHTGPSLPQTGPAWQTATNLFGDPNGKSVYAGPGAGASGPTGRRSSAPTMSAATARKAMLSGTTYGDKPIPLDDSGAKEMFGYLAEQLRKTVQKEVPGANLQNANKLEWVGLRDPNAPGNEGLALGGFERRTFVFEGNGSVRQVIGAEEGSNEAEKVCGSIPKGLRGRTFGRIARFLKRPKKVADTVSTAAVNTHHVVFALCAVESVNKDENALTELMDKLSNYAKTENAILGMFGEAGSTDLPAGFEQANLLTHEWNKGAAMFVYEPQGDGVQVNNGNLYGPLPTPF